MPKVDIRIRVDAIFSTDLIFIMNHIPAEERNYKIVRRIL
jgi:hypothetical protein